MVLKYPDDEEPVANGIWHAGLGKGKVQECIMFVRLHHLHSLNLPLPGYGAFIDLLQINNDSCLGLMMTHNLESCLAAWMDSLMAAESGDLSVARWVSMIGLDDGARLGVLLGCLTDSDREGSAVGFLLGTYDGT